MQKRNIHGVLLLDKAAGMTSNAALQKAKLLFQAQKAGHGGTLDPFATGLLPIFFGEASKFASYFLDADKEYEFRLQFGSSTTTCDNTGECLKTAPVPDLEAINWQKILQQFKGKITQTPPIFSALKVQGKRAYELARQGETPELKPREIEIFSLEIIARGEDFLDLRTSCSKGTYIRALARDIGEAIDCPAHCSQLRRRATAGFNPQKNKFYRLEELNAYAAKGLDALDKCLETIDFGLLHLPAYQTPQEKLRFIRNGNDIELGEILPAGKYRLYDAAGKFFGIGELRGRRIYPLRLLQI